MRACGAMDDGGKRVSWVELYLDIVFVLAVVACAAITTRGRVRDEDIVRFFRGRR